MTTDELLMIRARGEVGTPPISETVFDATYTQAWDDRAALLAEVDRLTGENAELRKTARICPSHGLAVLVTHVNDGEPCDDFLSAARLTTPETP